MQSRQPHMPGGSHMPRGRQRRSVAARHAPAASAAAPAAAAPAAVAPSLTHLNGDDDDICQSSAGSDSESDDDLSEFVADEGVVADEEEPGQLTAADVMANASATRITSVTRKLYDSHLRQMATWCLQSDKMRVYVGADGKVLEPLSSEVVVMFTEHLIQKKVPWPHAEVAGTTKHLAVKTVTNFFAAVNFSFALRNERISPEVAQFFYNTRKSYSLKIARLKDAGLHPDKTNSIGVNFSVYARICLSLGSYVAHFKGSCYSCWRDLWLFWIFLFNLLGRCLQVSKICYDWIWWQDDALVVKVPTQKGCYHTPPPHHLAAVHCHTPYSSITHHPHTTSLLFTAIHHTPTPYTTPTPPRCCSLPYTIHQHHTPQC